MGPRGLRMGSGEGFTMRNFIVYTIHLIYSGWLNLEDWDWAGYVAKMEEGRSALKILTGKLGGNRSTSIERPKQK